MTAPGLQHDFDVVELQPWEPPADATPPPALREVAFRNNVWTPGDDARLREHFAAGTAMPVLAWMLDRTESALRYRIWQLGLRRRVALPWSDLEDEELTRRYGAEPAADIARDLGRSTSSIYARATLLGLTTPAAPPWSEWEDAQLAAAYARDVPAAAVAELLGRPVGGLVSRAHSLGLRRPSAPRGWSDDEIKMALDLAHAGLPYREIMAALAAAGFPPRSKSGFGQKLRLLGYHRGWGRFWTPEEDDALRAAYHDGASLTPLRERLGRTAHMIRHRAGYLGLHGTHARPGGFRTEQVWTAEDDARLRADYGRVRAKVLAGTFGRSVGAVLQRANKLGLQSSWAQPWTDREAQAIAVAWRTGFSMVLLAGLIGRDPAVVGKYAHRLGYGFSDPRRPVKSPKGARKLGSAITLDQLLARATDDERQVRALPVKPRGAAAPSHPSHRKAA